MQVIGTRKYQVSMYSVGKGRCPICRRTTIDGQFMHLRCDGPAGGVYHLWLCVACLAAIFGAYEVTTAIYDWNASHADPETR